MEKTCTTTFIGKFVTKMVENVNIYLSQRRGKGGLGLFREITVYIYIYIIEWSICVTGNIRFF